MIFGRDNGWKGANQTSLTRHSLIYDSYHKTNR